MTHVDFVKEFRETIRAFDAVIAIDAQQVCQEAAYIAALDALDLLDPDPCRFRGCWVGGQFCRSLGEVVEAVEEAMAILGVER